MVFMIEKQYLCRGIRVHGWKHKFPEKMSTAGDR